MADPPRLPNSARRVSRIRAKESSGLRHPSVGVVAVRAAEPPSTSSWDILQRAAHSCEACPLYQNATQTVFGEGPRNAKIVLLGEQPGDAEDREGRPFIGHAGRLLDRALTQAGLDRESRADQGRGRRSGLPGHEPPDDAEMRSALAIQAGPCGPPLKDEPPGVPAVAGSGQAVPRRLRADA